MKKILLAALILTSGFRVFAHEPDPTVNDKVLGAFSKTFQYVDNVSWSEFKYAYEVRFNQYGTVTRVVYDKQGNILTTYRYYAEDKLPIMILVRVKQKFSDKKINGVVEESNEEGTTYHLTLEDAKTWLQVRVTGEGTIMVDKKLKKG
jgi:hypothetical protein